MIDASTLHAEQLEYWNGSGATRWVTRQEQMDTTLAPVADAAIALAAVKQGERVLDIGCGSGATPPWLCGRSAGPEHSIAVT